MLVETSIRNETGGHLLLNNISDYLSNEQLKIEQIEKSSEHVFVFVLQQIINNYLIQYVLIFESNCISIQQCWILPPSMRCFTL